MLEHHGAGDVVGEGDFTTQLVGEGAVGKGLTGNRLALNSAIAKKTRGCLDMMGSAAKEESLYIKIYNEAGRNGWRAIYPYGQGYW